MVGSYRAHLENVVIHRTIGLPYRYRLWRSHMPVTSLRRTVLDLASVLRPEALEATLDHLLARRRISVAELQAFLGETGRRGRQRAGILAGLLKQREGRTRHVDSGLQRRVQKLAARAADAGLLPAPVFEWPVQLANGRWRFPDVAYPEYRVGIEAQSYEHHSTLPVFARDLDRTLELMAEDWMLIPVTDIQLRRDAAGLVRLVAQILARRRPPADGTAHST